MTKSYPIYEVAKIIKNYAVKYNKNNQVHSLWYFEYENGAELVICTDKPGIWVGKAGKDIEKLKEALNKEIIRHNDVMQNAYAQGRLAFEPVPVPQLEISLIECNF